MKLKKKVLFELADPEGETQAFRRDIRHFSSIVKKFLQINDHEEGHLKGEGGVKGGFREDGEGKRKVGRGGKGERMEGSEREEKRMEG